MEKLKEQVARIRAWMQRPRTKKRLYLVLVVLLAMWVVYRFVAIGVQYRMQVFNPARAAAAHGVPVEVLEMKRAPGVVREPLTVKGNRALVSGARAHMLRAGQKVGDGEIVSVGVGIDLDTGMHVVRTRGVKDGLQFAEFKADGYFVPAYAVAGGVVYVVRDGAAAPQNVTVARSDADTAYITDGLRDGDIVILSRVSAGDKVKIKK